MTSNCMLFIDEISKNKLLAFKLSSQEEAPTKFCQPSQVPINHKAVASSTNSSSGRNQVI